MQLSDIREAAAKAFTRLADTEVDHTLRTHGGIQFRRAASGTQFIGAANRVTSEIAITRAVTFRAIVKRPPIRIRHRKSIQEFRREASTLRAISSQGGLPFGTPDLLAFESGAILGGVALVMSECRGHVHWEADYYQSRQLESLSHSYVALHRLPTGNPSALHSSHLVNNLAIRLFEGLDSPLRASATGDGLLDLGWVHGDPHPGNWLWSTAGDLESIVDWGGGHIGWPAIEVARTGLILAEQVGVQQGFDFLSNYLNARPIGPNSLRAAHRIAASWPIESLSKRAANLTAARGTKTVRVEDLHDRRLAYLAAMERQAQG